MYQQHSSNQDQNYFTDDVDDEMHALAADMYSQHSSDQDVANNMKKKGEYEMDID